MPPTTGSRIRKRSPRWLCAGRNLQDRRSQIFELSQPSQPQVMAILRQFPGPLVRLLSVHSPKARPCNCRSYISSGRHFWNSGIFMVQAGACIESCHRHQPDLSKAANSCWAARMQRADEDILVKPALEAVPAISVDYAIMEKEDRITLLPFDGGWSDVGSWDSLRA